MNVLSLFSGVGGMDMGLERAGHTIVGMCEIDKQARRVLRRHWPDVPLHDDVTTFDVGEFRGRVDLVAGGSPCQDLSVAGRRAGLDGQRSSLFWHQCRIADQLAAPWVLWENVAGAFSSNDGADFAAVLWGITGALPDVPDGGWRNMGICIGPKRTAVWRLLDARWFGVAQRRRRVFVVAGPTDGRWLKVLLEPESCDRDSRPSATAGQDVAGTLGGGTAGGGPKVDTDRMTFVPVNVGALQARMHKGTNADGNGAEGLVALPTSFRFVGGAQQDEIVTADQQVGALTHASNSHMGNHQPKVMVPFVKVVRSGARDADGNLPPEVWRDEQTAPTLNAMDNGGESRATVLAVSENQRGELRLTDYAQQLTAGGGKPGQGYPAVLAPSLTASNDPSRSPQSSEVTQQIAAVHEASLAVRRLTPVECERLMGWPDDWTRWADDGSEIADSHRYRMCGNGVVSNVTEWIGRRLADVVRTSAADGHATQPHTPRTAAPQHADDDGRLHRCRTAATQDDPLGGDGGDVMADHRGRPERATRGVDRRHLELTADGGTRHLSDGVRLGEHGGADAQDDIADLQVTDGLGGGGCFHDHDSTTNPGDCQPQTRGIL